MTDPARRLTEGEEIERLRVAEETLRRAGYTYYDHLGPSWKPPFGVTKILPLDRWMIDGYADTMVEIAKRLKELAHPLVKAEQSARAAGGEGEG